jgi:predicted RNA-binding Zn ribbon-like protein
VRQAEHETAPAELELVRRLLNTEVVPNGSRQPVDLLGGLRRDPQAWRTTFGGLSRPRTVAALQPLTELRDGLRRLVETAGADPADLAWLRKLLARQPVTATVAGGAEGLGLVLTAEPAGSLHAAVLAAVLRAVADGSWSRLKACPDCRWIFYDHTRNASKRWCGMNAVGPAGRSCGSIAKVRAYRIRQASTGARPGATPG